MYPSKYSGDDHALSTAHNVNYLPTEFHYRSDDRRYRVLRISFEAVVDALQLLKDDLTQGTHWIGDALPIRDTALAPTIISFSGLQLSDGVAQVHCYPQRDDRTSVNIDDHS